LPPETKVLADVLAAAARVVQPDPEVDREERDDDRDVQRAQRHLGRQAGLRGVDDVAARRDLHVARVDPDVETGDHGSSSLPPATAVRSSAAKSAFTMASGVRGDGARPGVARVVRSFLAAAFSAALFASAVPAAPGAVALAAEPAAVPMAPALVPQPRVVRPLACNHPFVLNRPVRFPANTDRGGFELLSARWTALGIPTPVIVRDGAPAYSIDVSSRIARAASFFDALTRSWNGAELGVAVRARSKTAGAALAHRLRRRLARSVSDDAYFKERIRGLAALKINGWSPYMEQVVRRSALSVRRLSQRLTTRTNCTSSRRTRGAFTSR
jgi:hypothetical protein